MFELHPLLLLYIFIYIIHPFSAGLTEEPPAVQGNSNRRSVSTLRPSAKDAYMLFQVRHLSITVHQRLTKHSRVSPGSGIAFGGGGRTLPSTHTVLTINTLHRGSGSRTIILYLHPKTSCSDHFTHSIRLICSFNCYDYYRQSLI